MISTLLVISTITGFLWAGSLVITIVSSKYKIWPPPARNSWQYWYTWILTIITVFGTLVISILDRNTFIFTHPSRLLIGGILMVSGIVFALWGVRTLNVHMSLGLKGKLIMEGPYKYSRNPQYVRHNFFIGLNNFLKFIFSDFSSNFKYFMVCLSSFYRRTLA
ncbi:hypothetical protein BHF71_01530 [Vulcanibacillus modesticaldus]|uniref:Steroid 5-alpha reductase C-terminal domain-containing protein n=1 Tax=Vulcanibacillus modesticaldus TaxID=337097 RepID=A0A1D2YW18_9BACI|nr:methyltransferase [Vulcanibacillus modesticaldus]OEF99881.1 hypothetical protein BHF71_01530 [Vulcanibacillus modesticaldus]